jgi:O-antigen/teichoic acid export membrane protein
MRNYLAQSISAGDFRKGRIYLSTTLAMLTCIAVLLILVSTVCTFSFDLNKVFNTTAVGNLQLTVALLIATVFTLIQFVVKNVGLVYVAMQRYAINDLLIVSGNVVALIIVYIITKTTETNLLYVVLTFTATPVVIFMLAAIPLFKKHPQLRPSLSSIDQAFARQILGKGLGFFFIQITSVLVIFGGANIFIAQALGQEAVTTYNIAYKFFNLLIIAYTIVIAPMWSAYTDASVKGDFVWIESTLKRTLAVWGLTLVAGFAMLALSGLFYRLWVGESVLVPFTVSCCVFVYASLFNLNSGVTALINGVNKIQVQIITSVVITVLYIVAVSFWGMRHGIEGIVICMAASYAIMSLIHLYQCRLIISRRARGIWNK